MRVIPSQNVTIVAVVHRLERVLERVERVEHSLRVGIDHAKWLVVRPEAVCMTFTSLLYGRWTYEVSNKSLFDYVEHVHVTRSVRCECR